MDRAQILILVNLLICSAGVFICACRLSHMSPTRTKPAIRYAYVLWLPVFVASGISWTHSEPPTIEQVALGAAILANLLTGIKVWRYGIPIYAVKNGGD